MRRHAPVLALALLVAAAAHGQTVEKRGFFRFHTSFGSIAGIHGMKTLANGDLLLSGCTFGTPGTPSCQGHLMALTPAGVYSWSAGTGGSLYDPIPYLIIPMPDGGAVVGGFAFLGPGGFFRIRPGGSPDATFGTNGAVRFTDQEVSSFSGGVRTPEGRLVFVIRRPSGTFQLVAWTENGRPDSTFGTNGTASLPGGGYTWGGLIPLSDGDMLVPGSLATVTDTAYVFARYTSSGTPRTRYGTDGILRIPLPADARLLSATSMLADGTLLRHSRGQSAIYRFMADGQPVSTFGTRGVVSLPRNTRVLSAPVLDLTTGRLVLSVTSASGQMEVRTLSPNGDSLTTTVVGGWDASVPGLTGLYRSSRADAVHVALDGTVSLGGVAFGPDGLSFYGLAWALARIRYPTAAEDRDAPADRRPAQVFPLPARGAVRLVLPSMIAGHDRVQIDILDVLGQTVLSLPDAPVEAGEAARLDVSTLAPGRYIVRLVTPTGTATAPLVVVR